VRPPRFEPGLKAWKANPKQLLSEFNDYCRIDLNLSESTTCKHIREITNFLKTIDKEYNHVTTDDVRKYLKTYKKKSKHTYANIIKSFRRFYRDFLRYPSLVDSFKLPRIGYEPKILPSKKDLQTFYNNLINMRDRALFLVLATSGLRRNEARARA